MSQAQLDRAVELILHNGCLPHVQSAIGEVEYNVEALQAVETLLQTWHDGLAQAQTLLTAQKRATRAEQEARRAAGEEISSLKRTVRSVFGNDEMVLKAMGMRPRRSTGTNDIADLDGVYTDDNDTEYTVTTRSGQPSQSTAATVIRSRRMVANALNLQEAQKRRLAEVGWGPERIANMATLVEDYARADDRQKDAMQAYRAQVAANKAVERELYRRLKEMRDLIHVAIEEVDPNHEQQMKEMRGV